MMTATRNASYDTPVALPGAVSLSLDANGEPENFCADSIACYVINNSMQIYAIASGSMIAGNA